VSFTIRTAAPGLIFPLSASSTYQTYRITPCESSPIKLASTNSSTTIAASSAGAPHAVKSPIPISRNLSDDRMGMLLYADSSFEDHCDASDKRGTGHDAMVT